MTLSEELTWRGFVNQTTYPDISVLDKDPITFYWGVDPSAKSMTVGNFALAMMVLHFVRHGHKPILLVGGATGLIGDPDGKATERDLKTAEELQEYIEGIRNQYKCIFKDYNFELVDNYDWFKDIGYMEFLRNIGKHVPMSQMLGREFVKERLGDGGAGISYAEFSYSLIQGYDFLHLSREKGVTLQVAGSDQWGNSIAGVDLVRRIDNQEVHVYTAPLVINKTTGKKFGKSEDGAVWLDPDMTSVYQFYQFWLNVDDEGVEDYLKIYTLLSKEETERILLDFNRNRAGRLAQKTLAYEVTKIVHGKERADSVKRISEVLFGGRSYNELTQADFEALGKEIGIIATKDGTELAELLVQARLAKSKSEARRFITSGAIYINGIQVAADDLVLRADQSINGHYILRRGKNSQIVLAL